jgi:hypothetical protein
MNLSIVITKEVYAYMNRGSRFYGRMTLSMLLPLVADNGREGNNFLGGAVTTTHARVFASGVAASEGRFN